MKETTYAIEVEHISKDYGDFAIRDMSFTVPKGAICGFIGQNGAGKTSTIQMILDVIRRDSGTIRVMGKDICKEGITLKDRIGVVYDEMGLHEFLTPVQVDKVMKHIYTHWESDTYFSYLSRFGLPKNKACGKFSRGMRMKFQIAIALSHQATLLIMDEPTSGLDPVVRNEVLQVFQDFVVSEDNTIFLSSHITGDIEKIADEVVFVNCGRIVLAGNKDELLERHGLIRCKADEVKMLDPVDVVFCQKGVYAEEVLVSDREKYRKLFPQLVNEQPSLEEIMIFYVSRDAKERLHTEVTV